MGTKNDPGLFDCYHAALPDEPHFTLLARDTSAPKLVRNWAAMRLLEIHEGTRPVTDTFMVREALECASDMEYWRANANGAWRRVEDKPMSQRVSPEMPA